ncbi:M protein, serotype 12-like [Artemia franciscana]|uniref:M protein, serotype 12-like n=1 Tax=Artemia franciscana TaxID=6661 RepID=UPI0032DA9ED3
MLGGIINEKEKFIKDLESQIEEIKSIFNETERKLNERISKAEEETHIIALKAEEERTYLAAVKGEIEALKLEKEELIKKIADLEKTCSDTKKDLLLIESTGEEKMKLVLEKDTLMKRLLSVEENASTAAFTYQEEKLNLLESLEAVKKELKSKLSKIGSF